MKKLLFSAFFAFALIAAQVGTVFAQDTTPPMGTVMRVEIDETTDVTTVLVTYSYVDETGATQEETVRLDLAIAEELDLVETNAAGETTVIFDPTVGAEIEIGLGTVVDDTTSEEDQHPVGFALAKFFGDLLGVDVAYDTIMSYRNSEDGENGNAGFGVLAQALWMTAQLQNDHPEVVDGNLLFQEIVEAKLHKDYNIEIELADGTTMTIEADNWGQFKKEILNKGDGDNNNSVGDVMSDKNDPDDDRTSTDETGEILTGQNENGNQNGNSGNNSGNENGNKNKNKDKDKGNKGKGHN